MTHEEIDALWYASMQESASNPGTFTRHVFAAKLAAHTDRLRDALRTIGDWDSKSGFTVRQDWDAEDGAGAFAALLKVKP
jgi:hypothetical protein